MKVWFAESHFDNDELKENNGRCFIYILESKRRFCQDGRLSEGNRAVIENRLKLTTAIAEFRRC